MTDWLVLALASGTGLLLGAFFFGGLWWTVRESVTAKRPALLFLVSILLRTSVAVTGFYFVGDADWQRLLACLAGFLVARLVVTRLTGACHNDQDVVAKQTCHAP